MALDIFNNTNNEGLDLPSKNNKLKQILEEQKQSTQSFGVDLFNTTKEVEKVKCKKPMSIYFDEDDLDVFKAVAYEKKTTVSKIIMECLAPTIEMTREGLLYRNVDIKNAAKQYDKTSKKRKNNK